MNLCIGLIDQWSTKDQSMPLKKKTFRKFLLGRYRAAICKWDWQCPYWIFHTVSAAWKVKIKSGRQMYDYPSVSCIVNQPDCSWVLTCESMGVKGIYQFKGWAVINVFVYASALKFIRFLGLCKTVRSKINSWKVVVKLWNGSEALQISRNGLDCKTDGLMIYKIPIHAPEKKNDIQNVCSRSL